MMASLARTRGYRDFRLLLWTGVAYQAGIAVVVAADHHIPDAAAFQRAAEQAVAAAQAGHIVTLGVAPREP